MLCENVEAARRLYPSDGRVRLKRFVMVHAATSSLI